jgi:hypothetical protein
VTPLEVLRRYQAHDYTLLGVVFVSVALRAATVFQKFDAENFSSVDRGDWWSWDRTCGVPGIDVMVQPTDAGRELLYLPQATEEDHGAPFKKNWAEAAEVGRPR